MKIQTDVIRSCEPKTKQQLAAKMNISVGTLQRKLKQAGLEVPRGFIPPDVQNQIYQVLGWTHLTRSDAKRCEMV